ncbi:MAG: helix-turn-helix transcriptional regulator [Clostridia bacterium]|nr:helix-turn-helix transcriptional regulator [Clostridia bacterium]
MYKRIRELREDRDLTQKRMGEILSCSQRVYSNYERGELDIPTEILIKLANYYDVSVDYILGRTDRQATNR